MRGEGIVEARGRRAMCVCVCVVVVEEEGMWRVSRVGAPLAI